MHSQAPARGSRRLTIRTVVVRISRKLRATYRIRTGPLFSRLLLAMVAAFPALARALPEGATIAAGQATVSTPTANAMVVNQATPKAILDWRSFSIGTGQSVQFVQPNSASVALNRVTGGNASTIYGSLSANGQVFLVNPAGVMFAPGAQVNVGGLVASTLSLSNGDFLDGRYTFSGTGGSVVNQGALKGGYIVLAAPAVRNSGTIDAQGGSVGLLAGSRVSVDTSGAGLVKFSVDAAAVNAAIANSGTITADGGQVALLASALSDTLPTVINQSGVIRANSIAEQGGVIVLSGGSNGIVKVTGTLEAKGDDAGEKGGTVKVLGDRVQLLAGSRIDASGEAGGGTVLVGGNWQGKGPEQNASATAMATGATILADAVTVGDGGTVVLWADGTTAVGGAISARGGAEGGNGGRVETSGKQSLAVAGSTTVDTRAVHGTPGTWLLDPTDITISSGGAAALGDVDQFSDAGSSVTIDPATLNASGTSVVLQATNNIFVNSAVNMTTAGAGLTAQAGNNVQVSAAITTNNGGITLLARDPASGAQTTNGNVTISAPVNAGSGTVTISNLGSGFSNVSSATITGGSVVFGSRMNLTGAVASDSISLTNETLLLGANDLLRNTATLDIAAGASLNIQPFSDTIGTLNLNGSLFGTGTLTAGTYNLNAASVNAPLGTGTINVLGGSNGISRATQASVVNINAGTLSVTGGLALSDTSAVTISGTGRLDLIGDETIGSLAGTGTVTLGSNRRLTTGGNGNTTTFDGVISGTGGGLTKLGTGTMTLTGVNTYTGGTTISAGTLRLLGGSIGASSGVTNNGTLDIQSGATIDSMTGTGSTTLNGNTLTIGDASNTSSTYGGTISGVGGFLIKAGTGTLTLTGANTHTGGTSINAGALNIQNSAALGSAAAGTTIASGAALQLQGGITVAQAITATGTGIGNTGAIRNISGTNTISNPVTLTGAATIGSTAGQLTVGGFTGTNTALTFDGAGLIAVSGAIATGSGTVTKLGTGATEFFANNTYSGLTTVSAGTLAASHNNALGSTAAGTTVASGASLLLGNVTVAETLTATGTGTGGFGAIAVTGAGVATLTGGIQLGGATTISTGTGSLTVSTGNITGSGANLTVTTGGGTATINSAIDTGAGTLTKTGAGTLNLAGNQLYTGTTRVGPAGGTLNVTGTLQSANVVVEAGSIMATTAADRLRDDGALQVDGAFNMFGNETVASLGGGGGISLGGFLTVDGAASTSYGGVLSGAGGLTKAGSGTLTLIGNNTYTGTTTVRGGALSVNALANSGVASNLGTTGTILLDGGTLVYTNTGAQATNRTFQVADGKASTIDTNSGNGTLTLTGPLVGATGTLVKTGPGQVVLAGANAAYTGGIQVDGGTASITNTNGASSLAVNNGGTLAAGASDVLANGATATVATGGTLQMGAFSDTIGNLVLNGGTVAGTGTLTATTYTLNGGTISANLGAGTLTQASGTSTLDGTSAATTVNVNGGTLALGPVANRLTGTAAAITIGAAGTLSTGTAAQALGGGSATVSNAGALVTGNSITAASLSGAGTTSLGGNVTTTGAQGYGALTLTQASVVTGAGVNFNGTVTGPHALTVNSTGATTTAFNGAVNVASVTTNADGGTRIGANVTTSGAQTYNDPVSLTAGVTLAGTDVSFNGALSGSQALTVNASGATTFSGNVSIGSLTTDAAGTTRLAGSLSTALDATFNDAVVLTANTSVGSPDGLIRFNGTVDGAFSLDVLGQRGTVSFGTVGGSTPLTSLNATSQVAVVLGGNVSTTSHQTYQGPVIASGGPRVLTSTGGGDINLARTVSAADLTVNTSGTTFIGGAVTATSLSTGGGGTTSLAANVSTSAGQSYGDAVVLQADVVASSSGGGSIAFGSTVDGARALTVNTTGATSFASAVGGTTALTSLATDAGGTTTLGGAVTTSGAQTYGDAVVLAAPVTATSTGGAAIAFNGTVNGAQALAVNTGGATVFGGAVGGTTALASLATDNGGTTTVGNGVRTTGGQSYGDNLVASGTFQTGNGPFLAGGSTTLAGDTSVSTGLGSATFTGAVDAAAAGVQSLAINATGGATFGAPIGAVNALNNLSFSGAGTVTLPATNLTGTLDVTAGALAQTGVLAAGSVQGSTTGAFDLGTQNNAIGSVGAVSGSTVSVRDGAGGLAVAGPVTASGSVSIATLGGTLDVNGAVGGAAVTLSSDGAISLDGAVTTAGTLVLNAGSSITQSAALSAATLTGTATTGSATLNNAGNTVGTLDAFATGTGFTLVDSAGGLSVNGAVNGGTGTASITTTTGGALDVNAPVTGANVTLAATGNAITLDAAVSTPGTLALNAGTSVSQTAALSAGTLTGSATGGSATLTNAGNAIGTLGAFDAGNGFSLVDNGGMTVAGPVTSGTGAAAIVTTGPLSVTGTVYGTGVTLTGTGVTQDAASTINGVSGDVLVDANDGTINLAGTITTTSSSATAVRIIDATTTSLGNISTGATGTVWLGTAGADSLNGAVTQNAGTTISTGTLTVAAATTVNLGNANTVTNLGPTISSGGFTFNDAGGGLAISGGVTDASGAMSITTAGGNLAVNNAVGGTGVTLAANGAGSDIVLGANVAAGTGTATLVADSDITRTAGTVSGSAVSLTATTGSITADVSAATLSGSAGTFATITGDVGTLTGFTTGSGFTLTDANSLAVAGAVSGGTGGVALAANGGTLTLQAAGDITAGGPVGLTGSGGIATAGDVTTTGGAVNYNGTTTLTGAVSVSSGSGAISFGQVTGGGNDLSLASTGGVSAGVISGVNTLTTGTGTNVAATSVTATSASLGGNVTTTGAGGQSYGSTTLTTDSVLDAGAANPIVLGAVTGNGNDLTLTGAASTSGASGLGALVANNDLSTSGALSATSVTVAGVASLGGNVTTSGSQAYTGTLQTAAGSTLSATGSLSATNPGNTIGAGTQFAIAQDGGGTGTLAVAGDFAGSVLVSGNATSVSLDDRSAATPFVVAALSAAPTADVTLVSAGSLQVDAANLSSVATLSATTQGGAMTFLNSGTVRAGTPGVLATGALSLNVSGGDLNTAADPLQVNAQTGTIAITATGTAHFTDLGAPPPPAPAPAPAPAPVSGQADPLLAALGVIGSIDGEAGGLLQQWGRDIGAMGRTEDLLLFGNLPLRTLTAPIVFRGMAIRLPRCVLEQKGEQPGCR